MRTECGIAIVLLMRAKRAIVFCGLSNTSMRNNRRKSLPCTNPTALTTPWRLRLCSKKSTTSRCVLFSWVVLADGTASPWLRTAAYPAVWIGA